MAVTVKSGTISTADPVADEQVVDMKNEFAELDPDDSQFVTLLTKLGTRQAVREKIEWLEDQLRPRLITLSASATSAASSINVTAGQGLYLAVDDTLRNLSTGELMRVNGITTDAIGVDRGIGATAAASSASTAQLLLVGSAYKQGASYGTSRIVQRILGYNYTQIVRDPFSFTGTETAIEEYGGRNPMKEQVKKLIEHKQSIEQTLFWGARNFDSTNKRGFCGGAYEFIATNVTSTNGTLDKSTFDSNITSALQHGNMNSKALFVSPLAAKALSGFLRDNWVRATPDETKWGVKVDSYISGAYGAPIPVFVKRYWNNFSNGASFYTNNAKSPAGAMFLLDMDYVRYAPLRDRDTALLMKRQAPGDDVDSREYLTEFSFEFAQESCHAAWFGVTG
jgi:hypothetical protein